MEAGKGMLDANARLGSDPAERALFSAVITPHRSLDPRSFRVMIVLLVGLAAAMGIRFVAFGFWPVAGFLGLDVLGLYIAFRISYRRARAFEEVVLTPIELLLRRVGHRGDRREWRFNPLWTQLERDTHAEFGLQRLTVVSRGQHIVIGGALSPAERADFADAFGDALGRAKRGGV